MDLAQNCMASEKVEISHKKKKNIKLSLKEMGFIKRSILTQSRVQPLALNTLDF
jgi:hypothetical protein